MSKEDAIHKNIDRYIDGLKMNTGRAPTAIHLFERDYKELLKAENKRRKEANPEAKEIRVLPPYKGFEVMAIKTKL